MPEGRGNRANHRDREAVGSTTRKLAVLEGVTGTVDQTRLDRNRVVVRGGRESHVALNHEGFQLAGRNLGFGVDVEHVRKRDNVASLENGGRGSAVNLNVGL